MKESLYACLYTGSTLVLLHDRNDFRLELYLMRRYKQTYRDTSNVRLVIVAKQYSGQVELTAEIIAAV